MALSFPSLTKMLRLPAFRRDNRIRLAIIGNCHLAALKLAELEGLVDADDFDICYYGSAGSRFWNMTLKDGVLDLGDDEAALRVTDGRYAQLPLDQFDAFMFHGGCFQYSMALKRFETVGLTPAMVSSAFLLETARRVFNLRGQVRRMPGLVAGQTDVPVLLSPSPLKARRSNLFEDTGVETTDIAALDTVLTNAAWENRVHFLGQPSDTIVENVYTDNRFAAGSVRLKGDLTAKHDEDEFGHMNAQYGALVLTKALDKLREILAEQAFEPGRSARPSKRRMA